MKSDVDNICPSFIKEAIFVGHFDLFTC